jgi:hypothetical protein
VTRAGRSAAAAALLALTAWMVSIAWWGGGVRAGWQFEEDYELIEIRQALDAGRGWVATAAHYAVDVERRARIYYLPRVASAAAFGDRIEGYRWSLLLVGIATAALFCAALRLRRFEWTEACLLTMLMFGGVPMTVWWRMGTTENLGMFFLSAALYAGLRSCEPRANEAGWKIASAACAAAASLSKESFLAVLPAFMWIQLWHRSRAKGVSIRSAAASDLSGLTALTALAAVQLWLIFNWTGSVIGGYVGVEGLSLTRLTAAGKDWVIGGYPGLFAALLALALVGRRADRASRSGPPRAAGTGEWPQTLTAAALITAPLLVLFQKTGMGHYYMLPAKLAHVVLLAAALRSVAGTGSALRKRIAVVLLAAQAVLVTEGSWRASAEFLDRSKVVGTMIGTVRNSSAPEDRILVVADAARQMEWSRASKIYLEHLAERTSVFLFPIIRPRLSDFEKFLILEHQHRAVKIFEGKIGPVPDIRMIVCLPQTEVWFLIFSKPWFRKELYNRTTSGNLTFYTRKDRL